MKLTCQAALAALALVLLAPIATASDEAMLKEMLQDFLANADKAPAHEKFWADDLVYSSSSGLRFGKAEILQGFEGVDADPGDCIFGLPECNEANPCPLHGYWEQIRGIHGEMLARTTVADLGKVTV